MLRVRDLDKSIDFYTTHLGMKLLRRTDFPSGEFTLAFVGDGDEADTAVIELTRNLNQDEPYDLGSGFGHIVVGVADICGTCDSLSNAGVTILRTSGPMKYGRTPIAFVNDPDGLPDRTDRAWLEPA